MPLPIEDYALIGDCHTAALVGRDGSIDWLCFPRFDSGACFAALLGDTEHGRWRIAPVVEARPPMPGVAVLDVARFGAATPSVRRAYRDSTLILETEFTTADGVVRIVDYMPLADERWDVVRIVEGVSGCVPMRMELTIRFDYGSVVPWVRRCGEVLVATAGPDTLELRADVDVRGENLKTVAEFSIGAGGRCAFTLNYRPSHVSPLPPLDPFEALADTERRWHEWSGRCRYRGPWRDAVMRSLITLKALIFEPTGGIVAAPTTSLPERFGGVRNWDYRYCWLRDSTFALNSLLLAGYTDEAAAWREWLLRAIAGSPDDLQTLYSMTGERRLDEYEVKWLPGYCGAAPVRVGNAASRQYQLDIYGEVMDTLHLARAAEIDPEPAAWRIQVALLKFLETHWQLPDEGIWEVRGPRRHFTHSKMMAWVAFDRAIKDAEACGLEGPVEHWREVRATIHGQVCSEGYDAARNTFVQSYGSGFLDASLLLMPLVGFLPPDDPRVLGTVDAIAGELLVDGLVLRYSTATGIDALPPGEGIFLPCSFWLVDCLVLTGRRAEGEALFEQLLALRNDVGLLSEEYVPHERHMLGNFPQALTHMALVNTARLLCLSDSQVRSASERGERPAAEPDYSQSPAEWMSRGEHRIG